jgi:sRNA-binding carbon storage regulator CsrA
MIEPAGIKITIVGVLAGGKVRLGIDAPQSQTILRQELVGNYERAKREAEQSLQRRKINDQAFKS